MTHTYSAFMYTLWLMHMNMSSWCTHACMHVFLQPPTPPPHTPHTHITHRITNTPSLFHHSGLGVGAALRGGNWWALTRGYTPLTWLIVGNLAVSGMTVSWLMKFGDSILKVCVVGVDMVWLVVVWGGRVVCVCVGMGVGVLYNSTYAPPTHHITTHFFSTPPYPLPGICHLHGYAAHHDHVCVALCLYTYIATVAGCRSCLSVNCTLLPASGCARPGGCTRGAWRWGW